METSLKTGFAQIFSCCPKLGGAAAPLAPPARTPMVACNATPAGHLWYVNYITPFPRNVSLGRLWCK